MMSKSTPELLLVTLAAAMVCRGSTTSLTGEVLPSHNAEATGNEETAANSRSREAPSLDGLLQRCGACTNLVCLEHGSAYYDLHCPRSRSGSAAFYKDGVEIRQPATTQERENSTVLISRDTFGLRLRRPSASTSGVYDCRAPFDPSDWNRQPKSACWCVHQSTSEHELKSCRQHLQLPKLSFTAAYRRQLSQTVRSVPAGQTAVYTCYHNGTSSSHITWTHKGHRVLPSRTDGASRFRILNVGNEELHIRLLRPSDSGTVRCHFHDMNTGSRDSVTYHLQVIPSMSNARSRQPTNSTVNALSGRPALLSCPVSLALNTQFQSQVLEGVQVSPANLNQVSWTKNGGPLQDTPRYVASDNRLVILAATYEDSGNFRCCSSSQCSNITLRVRGPPPPPSIRISRTSSHRLLVSIAATHENGGHKKKHQPHSAYHMSVRLIGYTKESATSGINLQYKLTERDEIEIDTRRLLGCQKDDGRAVSWPMAEVSVRSRNAFGFSEPSKSLVALAPLNPPQVARVTSDLILRAPRDGTEVSQVVAENILQKVMARIRDSCICCYTASVTKLGEDMLASATVVQLRVAQARSTPPTECSELMKIRLAFSINVTDTTSGLELTVERAINLPSTKLLASRTCFSWKGRSMVCLENATSSQATAFLNGKDCLESGLNRSSIPPTGTATTVVFDISAVVGRSGAAASAGTHGSAETGDSSLILLISSILIPLLFQYALSLDTLFLAH